MQIHFLGTNGFYTTPTGNTVCILIQTADANIVLDAGNGIYLLDKYISMDDERPIYLFLSHFHLDHIFGLHMLAKFRFKTGIEILGQPGTREILQKFINSPFTTPISLVNQHRMPLRIRDLREGLSQKPFPLRAEYLIHADPCFGYRFEFEGKSIAYCTDTGICDNLFRLADGVDLLIIECTMKVPTPNSQWPHLSPTEAAEVAVRAKVKRVILTHFDPREYTLLEDRKWAEKAAKKIFPNVEAAYDEMRIDL